MRLLLAIIALAPAAAALALWWPWLLRRPWRAPWAPLDDLRAVLAGLRWAGYWRAREWLRPTIVARWIP